MTFSGAGAVTGALIVAYIGKHRHIGRLMLIFLGAVRHGDGGVLVVADTGAQRGDPVRRRRAAGDVLLADDVAGAAAGAARSCAAGWSVFICSRFAAARRWAGCASGWLVTQVGSAPAVLMVNGVAADDDRVVLPDPRPRSERRLATADRKPRGCRYMNLCRPAISGSVMTSDYRPACSRPVSHSVYSESRNASNARRMFVAQAVDSVPSRRWPRQHAAESRRAGVAALPSCISGRRKRRPHSAGVRISSGSAAPCSMPSPVPSSCNNRSENSGNVLRWSAGRRVGAGRQRRHVARRAADRR